MAARYTPLFGSLPHPNVDVTAGVGSPKDPHVLTHLKEQAELDRTVFLSKDFTDYCGAGHGREEERAGEWGGPAGEAYVRQVVASFLSPSLSLSLSHSDGARRLFLGDWIDDVVGSVVGDSNTHLFLSLCLSDYKTPPEESEREREAADAAEAEREREREREREGERGDLLLRL